MRDGTSTIERMTSSYGEVVDWLEIRMNRMLTTDSYSLEQVDEDWEVVQGNAQQPSRCFEAIDSSGLLIVIATFNRALACERLAHKVSDALSDLRHLNPQILVLDDASSVDYSRVRNRLAAFGKACVHLRGRRHLGKQGFWKTYQTAFFAARSAQPQHVLFLQDDVEIYRRSLSDGLAVWESIQDTEKVALYLLSSEDDEKYGRWVRFRRRHEPNVPCRLTQWFDLQGFLVGKRFFELLQYRVFPIHPNRWWLNPSLSSGVGAQLTRRLWRRGNIYQVFPSLVCHGGHPSLMNPSARALRALDNRSAFQDFRPV